MFLLKHPACTCEIYILFLKHHVYTRGFKSLLYCMSFEKIRNQHCKLFNVYSTIAISLGMKLNDRPVGRAVTRSSLEREVKSHAICHIRSCCNGSPLLRHFFERNGVARAQ